MRKESPMRFVVVSSSLTIAAALFLGCSPAMAQPKVHQADAGQTQPPHKPKSTSPDGAYAVAKPKFSTDACTKDEECAPVAMCHSDRCVGAEHAGAMPADTMCSMECRGGTVDCAFNHCACVASTTGEKFCALVPGPSDKR